MLSSEIESKLHMALELHTDKQIAQALSGRVLSEIFISLYNARPPVTDSKEQIVAKLRYRMNVLKKK